MHVALGADPTVDHGDGDDDGGGGDPSLQKSHHSNPSSLIPTIAAAEYQQQNQQNKINKRVFTNSISKNKGGSFFFQSIIITS